MLNFAQYRRTKLVEEQETVTMPSPLISDLEKTIDDFVGQLKSQLVNASSPEARRGIWDRIKGWWSNLWYGRDNQNNPYYWKNKLGDEMGRTTESVLPIPLSHYSVLREQATLLELSLPAGAEKLQIIRVIDNWARQFKAAIMSVVNKNNMPVSAPPEPEAQEKPIELKPLEKPAEKQETPVQTERQKDLMSKLELLKDKISDNTYETLKRNINSGNEEQMNMVQVFLDKEKAPEAKPEVKPDEAKPETSKAPESLKPGIEESLPPKADGRSWKQLSPNERELWDEVGGGNAGDVSKFARVRLDIRTIPWILRIGDPRIKEIEKIPGRSFYTRLVQEKRIESPAHPIKTTIDLEKAVEEARTLTLRDRDRVSEERVKRHQHAQLKRDLIKRLTQDEDKDKKDKDKEKEKKKKIPRTAPNEPEDLSPPSKSVDNIMAELESIKDEIDDRIYNQLKKWINSGDDQRIAAAQQKIDSFKKTEIEAEEGSGGGITGLDESITKRTISVISRFRDLVNEKRICYS